MTLDAALLLNSTCDSEQISDGDMQHCHFLKLTCDIGDPPSGGQTGGVYYGPGLLPW